MSKHSTGVDTFERCPNCWYWAASGPDHKPHWCWLGELHVDGDERCEHFCRARYMSGLLRRHDCYNHAGFYVKQAEVKDAIRELRKAREDEARANVKAREERRKEEHAPVS